LQAVLSAVEVKSSAPGDEHWMLKREIFQELEQEYGPFDLDGAACVEGTNAQLPVFCSPAQPFEALDLAGKSVYVNPPFSCIPAFLDHYLQCKGRLRTQGHCSFCLSGLVKSGGTSWKACRL